MNPPSIVTKPWLGYITIVNTFFCLLLVKLKANCICKTKWPLEISVSFSLILLSSLVRIRSLIPDLQSKTLDETVGVNHEVKKSNSERRKFVQWDPNVPKFPGRALSEKSARKKRSGSVSVITNIHNNRPRDDKICDSESIQLRKYQSYPYTRHGSLPHAFRNGNRRQHLGELLVSTIEA